MATSISHDEMSRRDICSIYCRRARIAPMKYWPELGFAVPCIDGAYYVNHSDSDMYVCGLDGLRHKIPKLTDEERNIVLTQLYLAMGCNTEGEKRHRLNPHVAYGNRDYIGISIEPNAQPEMKETKSSVDSYRYYEPSWFVPVDDAINFLSEKTEVPMPSNSPDYYKVKGRNAIIREANQLDDRHGITAHIRGDDKGLTIFKPYNHETLRYNGNFNGNVRGITLNHTQSESPYDGSFEILDSNGKFQEDGAKFLQKGEPTIVWNFFSENQVKRAFNGIYRPEYGATVGTTGTVSNMHYSLYDPASNNYIAKAGIRFIVPNMPSKSGRLFVKLGDYVQELCPTIHTQEVENVIAAYVTDVNGNDIRVGSDTPDNVLRNGLQVHLPDGTQSTIPFFGRRADAVDYVNPDIKKEMDKRDACIVKLNNELKQYRAEEKKRKEAKKGTVMQWLTSLLSNKTVITVLTSIVVSVASIVFGFLKN